jgi:hypothetical protein
VIRYKFGAVPAVNIQLFGITDERSLFLSSVLLWNIVLFSYGIQHMLI